MLQEFQRGHVGHLLSRIFYRSGLYPACCDPVKAIQGRLEMLLQGIEVALKQLQDMPTEDGQKQDSEVGPDAAEGEPTIHALLEDVAEQGRVDHLRQHAFDVVNESFDSNAHPVGEKSTALWLGVQFIAKDGMILGDDVKEVHPVLIS